MLEAVSALGAEGYDVATLGMSPLAPVDASFASLRPEDLSRHPRLLRLLRAFYRYGDAVYCFRALHHYKAKYAPTWWEADYALCWPRKANLRLVWSVLQVFDDGGSLGALGGPKLRRVLRRRARRA